MLLVILRLLVTPCIHTYIPPSNSFQVFLGISYTASRNSYMSSTASCMCSRVRHRTLWAFRARLSSNTYHVGNSHTIPRPLLIPPTVHTFHLGVSCTSSSHCTSSSDIFESLQVFHAYLNGFLLVHAPQQLHTRLIG